MEIHENTDSFI